MHRIPGLRTEVRPGTDRQGTDEYSRLYTDGYVRRHGDLVDETRDLTTRIGLIDEAGDARQRDQNQQNSPQEPASPSPAAVPPLGRRTRSNEDSHGSGLQASALWQAAIAPSTKACTRGAGRDAAKISLAGRTAPVQPSVCQVPTDNRGSRSGSG